PHPPVGGFQVQAVADVVAGRQADVHAAIAGPQFPFDRRAHTGTRRDVPGFDGPVGRAAAGTLYGPGNADAAVGGRRLQLIHLHAVQANAAVGRGQPRFGDPQVPATHRTVRRLALQAVAQPLGQDDSYRCFHVPSVGGHQPEAAVRHFPAGRLRRQLLRQVRVLDADVVGDFHAVAGP